METLTKGTLYMKTTLLAAVLAVFSLLSSQYSLANENAQETVQQSFNLVNINDADIASLMKLVGVGESKAKAIINYRNLNGPFKSVEDLVKVKGIGKAFLKKNKRYLLL